MPRFTGPLAPLAAAATALAAFACCVPLGLFGALGIFTLGGQFDRLQPWFMSAALFLLAIGIYEFYQGQKICRRKSLRFSLVVLGLSSTIVLAVLLFPQTVAGLVADHLL